MIISGEVEASPTISASRAGCGGKRRAGWLGLPMESSRQRGQARIVSASAASACGGAVHRFLFSPETKNFGKLRLRSAREEYGFKRWY